MTITNREQADAVQTARQAERAADAAFATGNDDAAASLYRQAARAYQRAGMPQAAKTAADAAKACQRWGCGA